MAAFERLRTAAMAVCRRIATVLPLLPSIASAGADDPWNELGGGDGNLSAVALWIGLAVAAYFGGGAFMHGASISESPYAAFMGMTFALMIGWPVACAFC